ncbi:nitrate/nitrite transporter [Salinibacterium sp. ZJ70]|uniref:MFS transporter n=1 Tax=Salinibacterium sp. ZJ70 TaxID=2708084 RepID=UPI00141F54D4|nr:MFS transporter [Salinibacterium sp. ZJ70]
MNSRRAWIVFAAAAFAYLIAVVQRTSFGVAGVEATELLDTTASAVSVVAVVQIIVYAVLQIPVGVLVDRVGATPLIIIGACTMAAGQALLAFADSMWLALVARVLVGAGDAATFVSVLRLIPGWFQGPIVPQLSQWVGMSGQLGQVISAFPFALVLHSWGWTPAFLLAAGAGFVSAVIALAFVRRAPENLSTGEFLAIDPLERGLRASLSRTGTHVGFWAHLVAGTTPTLIGIMWGYPFLTAGLGYPTAVASAVFTMIVAGSLVTGPVVGWLIARYPMRRSDLVLVMTWTTMLLLAVVLVWPTTPPVWLVAILFFTIGWCSPASLIGIDVARSSNPLHAAGTATGFANSGGFVGGFIGMLAVGVVLDLVNHVRVDAGEVSQLYSLDGFRAAFASVFVIIGVSTIVLLILRGRTRRHLFEEQGIQIAPLWVALFSAPGWMRRPGVRQ